MAAAIVLSPIGLQIPGVMGSATQDLIFTFWNLYGQYLDVWVVPDLINLHTSCKAENSWLQSFCHAHNFIVILTSNQTKKTSVF